MNSLSRANLLSRVASSFMAQRLVLPKISPTICSPDVHGSESLLTTTRAIRTQNISHVSATKQSETGDGIIKRIVEKYNLFNISHIKLQRAGFLLYESVADSIDYAGFFREFKMSDSFFSWFLITELHVWMLMVRTMAENENGKITRNAMIEAMWSDSSTRAKVLWAENPGGIRKQIRELSEQFNCAIIGYDEGVNGNDKVLAGAIWRRFFQLERNDPEDIEKLLIYIRKQIRHLDQLPAEIFLSNPNIKWLPLNDR